MFERFTEPKTTESKEVMVKRVAREILERFRARIRKSEGTDYVEEEMSLPEPNDMVAPSELQQTDNSEISEIKPETEDIIKPQKKEIRAEKTDKGPYESIVTNNYFEGWDELGLDGNEGIKEKIKENIKKAEKNNEEAYIKAASELDISVEEFKARLQAKVEEMVRSSNFFRATEVGVLERVMNIDGRWKSQFETATSNGTLHPEYRAAQEIKMFGFNEPDAGGVEVGTYGDELPEEVKTKNRTQRPIYGYFSDNEHGGINDFDGKIPPPTSVNWYGKVNFKIKKERALKKATITFHDSLGVGNEFPPTPASTPHFTSFKVERYYGASGRVLEKLKNSSIVNWGGSYTEVQYHGQLTMQDVESVHVSTHNGIHPDELGEIRRIFKEYKKQHPESTIQLIEF